jgi:hypothetical protein
MQHELDRKKTVTMKNNTKRRMKKQTIEKKIMDTIMYKIVYWTKECNGTKIKKMRNNREQYKISGFFHNSH